MQAAVSLQKLNSTLIILLYFHFNSMLRPVPLQSITGTETCTGFYNYVCSYLYFQPVVTFLVAMYVVFKVCTQLPLNQLPLNIVPHPSFTMFFFSSNPPTSQQQLHSTITIQSYYNENTKWLYAALSKGLLYLQTRQSNHQHMRNPLYAQHECTA